MDRDSLIDYISYTLFKIIGPIFRILPVTLSMAVGRLIGRLIYFFDSRHRLLVFSNIKRAFRGEKSLSEIKKITQEFYINFGQNIIDIFLIPLANKRYLDKYITVEGSENITEAFKDGKGVIFTAVHAGSWELSNVICANLGFPFRIFIRNLKFPRLNELLNSYRRQNGCRIVERGNQMRQLLEALHHNEAVGMTLDQGGRDGVLVDFLGRDASMGFGAVKIALKNDSLILPAYYVRSHGPYHKVIISKPFRVKKTDDLEKDIQINLQEVSGIFEKLVYIYPKEYLWTYKVWKYSRVRKILILSDGKAGHLRQSETVAKILGEYFGSKGISTQVEKKEVKIKNKFISTLVIFRSFFQGRYSPYSWNLGNIFRKEDCEFFTKTDPDIVVSCGSSVSLANYAVSVLNSAKSISILRPSFLGFNKFDLVIMPEHDRCPKRKNIVTTEAALNLADAEYLRSKTQQLLAHTPGKLFEGNTYLGLLVGGDAKDFSLEKSLIEVIITQLILAAKNNQAEILATTSRRTSRPVEELFKEKLAQAKECPYLVIANDFNPDFAVGGILGLSKILVVSPESISMISEAISSGKHVIVFDTQVKKRHRDFLNNLHKKGYIRLIPPEKLAKNIEMIIKDNLPAKQIDDRKKIRQVLEGVL